MQTDSDARFMRKEEELYPQQVTLAIILKAEETAIERNHILKKFMH